MRRKEDDDEGGLTEPFDITEEEFEAAARGPRGLRARRMTRLQASSSSDEGEGGPDSSEDEVTRAGLGIADRYDEGNESDDAELARRGRHRRRMQEAAGDLSRPVSFVSKGFVDTEAMQVEGGREEEENDEEKAEERPMAPRGRVGRAAPQKKQKDEYSKYGIGAKLLKGMGWKEGEGLGPAGKGMAEPIEVKMRPKGRGLSYGIDERTEQQKRDTIPPEQRKAAEEAERVEKQWKRGKKKKKVKFEVVDLEEESEAIARQSVIDMRGRQTRTVGSVAEALKETEEAEAKSAGPLRPLQHNVRLLADMAQAAALSSERRIQSAKATLESLNRTREGLKRSLESSSKQISRIEGLAAAVSEAVQAKDVSSGKPSVAAFANLRERFPEEWKLYNLDRLAFGLALSWFMRALASWSPIQDPISHSSEVAEWREVLRPAEEKVDGYDSDVMVVPKEKDSACYSQILVQAFLPRVRQAILSWNPRNSGPLVALLATWKPTLPQTIFDNVVCQLLLPRLRSEVEQWNPRTDTAPIHVWLHPWLPLIDAALLEPLWAPIRQKIASALGSWSPSDPSAHAILLPWKDVFGATAMDALLARTVVPKLAATLQAFVVNPQSQTLDGFHWVMAWCDLLPGDTVASLLEEEFFPKWSKALATWLLSGSADFNEVQRWYVGWKSQIPPALQQNVRVEAQLNYALELMNSAVSGVPPPPPPQARQRYAEAKAASATVSALQRPVRSTAAEPSLRDVLEQLAAKNDIMFTPTIKVHEGKAVYKFGATSIIVDSRLVLAQSPDGSWKPVTLTRLVEENEGATTEEETARAERHDDPK